MSNIIYLKMMGEKQGLISAGSSSVESIGNKHQAGHENEIFVYEVSTTTTRGQNVSFQPIEIQKTIDKSSPLIFQSLINNELLTCDFSYYRTSMSGGLELYYKIKLTEASVINLTNFHPNSSTHNEYQPMENVSFNYKSITIEHVIGGTSAYGIWDDSIY